MAGTVQVIESATPPLQKVAFSWTSDASGDADAVTSLQYRGYIERVITVPGGGGTQPTTLYDVTIVDGVGADLLMGNGANRSNTVIEQIAAANLGLIVGDIMAFAVRNAGDTKAGACIVYIRSV